MKFPESVHPFLRRHRIGVLSVIDHDGYPHSATLHFSWDEANNIFVFFTKKQTKKHQAIAKGASKASLVIGFSEEEFCTVQMHGEASILLDATSQEVHLEKFPDLRLFAHDESAVFLQFVPEWFRYSDLKPGKGIKISSDD